jgi:cyclophilin family peptidyl-prolyl cis-trans isomerase
MIKRISIGIIVLAILLGAGGIYVKINRNGNEPTKETTSSVQSPIEAISEKAILGSSSLSEAKDIVIETVTIQPTNIPSKPEKGPYPMEIDTKKNYEAVLTTTEGVIIVQLNASKTPITVNNFVTLSRKNFYDNTIFHRVIKGFMIQGGDPKGNGTGGPGYTFADEPFTGEYTKGTIAMANAGPNTNGSQFFIMHSDYPLPKNYVIFGKVTKGLEIVDKIAEAPTKPGGEGSTPITPVKILSVQINER